MLVTGLQVQNVMRLEALKLELDDKGGLVIIGGENEAGKSTALNSIEMALRGKSVVPPDPIRHGAESGEIIVTLGGHGDDPLVVTRTFTGDKSSLKVTTPKGAVLKAPQQLLDSFYNNFIDPLEFINADSKEKVQVLKDLTGLDFAQIDEDRAAAYANRTEVNKAVKVAEARLQRMTHHGDVYAEAVNVQGMLDLRKDMEEEKAERVEKEAQVDRARTYLDGAAREIESRKQRIEEIEQQVGAHYKILNEERESYKKGEDSLSKLRIECEKLQTPDFTDIDAKIALSGEHNSKYEENQRYAAEKIELESSRDDADAYTDSITTLDQQKKDMIAGANMPVEGLAFGEDGVTFNGIVSEQWSQAQGLKISTAIGLAMNPKLRILLIRNGSLLDGNSMKIMAEIAKEKDAKIFIERVGNADENAIIIEDGMVKQ